MNLSLFELSVELEGKVGELEAGIKKTESEVAAMKRAKLRIETEKDTEIAGLNAKLEETIKQSGLISWAPYQKKNKSDEKTFPYTSYRRSP